METPDRHIATPTAGDSANSIGVSRGRRRNHDAQFACCFCSEIFSLEISRKCHEVKISKASRLFATFIHNDHFSYFTIKIYSYLFQ